VLQTCGNNAFDQDEVPYDENDPLSPWPLYPPDHEECGWTKYCTIYLIPLLAGDVLLSLFCTSEIFNLNIA
jgi:hypothetical protein